MIGIISSINFENKYKLTSNKILYKNSPINDSVSFCGNKSSKSKMMHVVRKIKSYEDVFKYADYIGRGTEGSVYKLKNADYCVKVPHNLKIGRLFGKWTLDISEREKKNNIAAVSENGAKIIKYIPGSVVKDNDVYFLPNSSYRNLLKQVSNAYNDGLYFDPSPFNIIYNKKDDSLSAIDFYSLSCRQILNGNDKKYPFRSVYKALSSNHIFNNEIYNKILLSKLIEILLDEIYSKKVPDFIIDKSDIKEMFELFEKNLPVQKNEYTKLKEKISDILNNYESIQKLDISNEERGKLFVDIISAKKLLKNM